MVIPHSKAGYLRVTHPFATFSRFTEVPLPHVRLACVRHAASVHPEPGSNSPSIDSSLNMPKTSQPLTCRFSFAYADCLITLQLLMCSYTHARSPYSIPVTSPQTQVSILPTILTTVKIQETKNRTTLAQELRRMIANAVYRLKVTYSPGTNKHVTIECLSCQVRRNAFPVTILQQPAGHPIPTPTKPTTDSQ